ncbi:hypothetical protein LPB140_11295 [Sphingorhabdus lutea]|uniref:Beta-lactamase-related domain-containing protein n=1 Tax=Sphingorhabdus lutea TaxID=1913578 RepID=A0A1L3JDP7_9SPHN|nr:serine hydrolase [Sphingorhabdus lutea]APG63271.1 hypothetical protein LPB140_11295 [Sphingorhabdus lutea]
MKSQRNKYGRVIPFACAAALALCVSACSNDKNADDKKAKAASQITEEAPETGEIKDGIANYADDAALSKKQLAALINPFFEDDSLSETRAVVIMHGGKIVAERYADGYGPESRLISWSMAKTVTATLAGMMVADGRLSLDRAAPVDVWSAPGDPRGKITLKHLLHMSSGLDHTEMPEGETPIYEVDTTKMLFLGGRDDVARYAEGRQLEAQPGKKYEYSSATSMIIADIMTDILTSSKDPAIRQNAMLTFAKGRLFEPLGMTSFYPEFDRNGTMLGGSMIHGTPRDWAKLGEFLRNNGSVGGAQLLPTSWPRFMRTSSNTDAAYGGHIWLNKKRPDGRNQVLFPDRLESSIFAMLGHLGQYVIVAPERKLTIVRMGKTRDDQLAPITAQLGNVVAAFPKD